MSVEELEEAVSDLSAEDLARFSVGVRGIS